MQPEMHEQHEGESRQSKWFTKDRRDGHRKRVGAHQDERQEQEECPFTWGFVR